MRRWIVRWLWLAFAILEPSQSALAQLRDGSDGTLPPKKPEPCSDLIPPLSFSKEDFEKGFDRTYTIPDFTECDGVAVGGDPNFFMHQSGRRYCQVKGRRATIPGCNARPLNTSATDFRLRSSKMPSGSITASI